jgi:molybdopterin molybdotransferase
VIPLTEAQQRLIALAPKAMHRTETVSLVDAAGRYALTPLHATRTQPATALSAMDGYAIRAADKAGPWTLIGVAAAGAAFSGVCNANETVRIFTGAPLPRGTDTVVMQEDTVHAAEQISLREGVSLRPQQHVRARASDFAEWALLLAAGSLLTPARLGLLAAGGHGSVAVAKPIRVALLSTGDELVPPGNATAMDQIPASNDVMLSALLGCPGVIVENLGIVRDEPDALASAISRAQGADILITLGGASVGDHDLVRAALIKAGAEIDFWKVAMRPGKPLMAGKLGAQIVLGLPGNPVSAYVTALLFARPLIAALLGSGSPFPTPQCARLGAPMEANGPRTDHIRAYTTTEGVFPLVPNDSAALSALGRADCLIVRQAHSPAALLGQSVEILPIA